MKKVDHQLNDITFNCEGSIFMGAERSNPNCQIGLYGVNYDGTSSFRPGARFGPSEIRNVSSGIESYCPQFNLDLETIDFADFGNLEIQKSGIQTHPKIKSLNFKICVCQNVGRARRIQNKWIRLFYFITKNSLTTITIFNN